MWQVWKLTGFVSECQTEQGVWTFCLVHWVLNWGIRVQALAGIMSCILCHVKEAVIYYESKNRLYLQEMARIFVDNLFHILFLIVLFTLKIQYFNYKLFSIMDYRSFLNQFLCLISFFLSYFMLSLTILVKSWKKTMNSMIDEFLDTKRQRYHVVYITRDKLSRNRKKTFSGRKSI